MADYQGEFGTYASEALATGVDDRGALHAAHAEHVVVSQPVFAGIVSAVASSTPSLVDLAWALGTDAKTAQLKLRYRVYAGTSLPLDYLYPVAETNGTQTSMTAAGYVGQTNYFAVRAVNEFGIEDTNTATVPVFLPTNTTPPFFGGLTVGGRIPETDTARVGWAMASSIDPQQPANDLDILVWVATTPGGQNFAGPPTVTADNDYTYAVLTGLDPDTDYYAVGRARDDYGNLSSNTEEIWLPKEGTGGDPTPPTVTDISPAPGTPIGRQQTVSVTVEDAIGLRRVLLFVTIAGITEVAHNGDAFIGSYALGSYAVPTALGRRYHLKRSGGWTAAPTFQVYAFDIDGNEV